MKIIPLCVAVYLGTIGLAQAACPATAEQGEPISPPSNTLHSVCINQFIHSMWDEHTRTPRWVAETVTRDVAKGKGNREEGWKFKPDPVLGKLAPRHEDYTNAMLMDEHGNPVMSTFMNPKDTKKGKKEKKPTEVVLSRGHMADAANYGSDADIMVQTFNTANIAPQVQRCNNSGVWASIEEIVKDWIIHYGKAYVVTAPFQTSSHPQRLAAGEEVPSHLWKVVMVPTLNKSVAFYVPNVPLCGASPKDFAISQDELEAKVGMKFFPKLSGYDHSNRKLLE